MMYTSNSDHTLVFQAAQWWSKGLTWAEIATNLNKNERELEELPLRFTDLWVKALEQIMVIAQQELMLKAMLQMQTILAKTTDPRALATLVTALTRLLKTMPNVQHHETATPTHPPELPPIPVPVPVPTSINIPAEPKEKLTEIQAKLSSGDQTRYLHWRKQFPIFSVFLTELQRREPAIYLKLRSKNLLPTPPTPPPPLDGLPQTGNNQRAGSPYNAHQNA